MAATRSRVATLEAFIIDTFTRVENGQEVPVNKPDQLGGAGTYAIIGARIFLPPEQLAMIIDYAPGTLPASMSAALNSFGEDMWAFRLRKDGNGTTRAVNRYTGERRIFEYLTPPRLLSPNDLLDTRFGDNLPDWIHLVSFPERALECLGEVEALRATRKWSPSILWEPEPPCCVPANLDLIAQIARQVDVISPNHTEAMGLFGLPPPPESQLQATVEWLARRMVAMRPRVGAVIRAGPLGCCYVLTAQLPPGSVPDPHMTLPPCVPVHWIPPYWHPSEPGYAGAVVDPTGAGNAFMGGLAAALHEGRTFQEACIWANVAASFVIEQDGLPRLALINKAEVWNGDFPSDRVAALQKRIAITSTYGGVERDAGAGVRLNPNRTPPTSRGRG